MRNGLCALICLELVSSAACNQVWNAVTTEDCQPGSTSPECASTGWPTTDHGANSDPWLVTHNQVITSMRPNVLVLNFDNSVSSTDTMTTAKTLASALADGSSYQGYQDAAAPKFLQYTILPIVDLTNYNPNNPSSNPNNPPVPPGWTNPSSSLLPTDSTGKFDPTQLFQAQFANFGFSDASLQPLSLCQLFENGDVNEVWIQDGETDAMGGPQRRAPLYLERKQMYDDTGSAISGSFEDCIGGGSGVVCLDGISCNVTVRLVHIDPTNGGEGVSCNLEVQGWGIEGMWKVLPSFQADAYAFLNRDFDTRFTGITFNGWPDICDLNGTPCVSYPSDPTEFAAASPPGAAPGSPVWNIPSPRFRQGCGSSQFQPNATLRGDFGNTTTNVESRCAHFGLGDAPDGTDAYETYPAATVAAQDQTYVGDCGGGWQIYWRQSMPGYQNHATARDGTPMKNWWPMLFY
jgi:hypothetical protein